MDLNESTKGIKGAVVYVEMQLLLDIECDILII